MSSESNIDKLVHELEQLQLREATIIKQIKKIRERQQQEATTTGQELSIDSRVRIINKPAKPTLTSPVSPKDWTGTVTNVTTTRVYLTTDNGVETWRARKNVRAL